MRMELLVTGGWFDETGECWLERVAPDRRERVLTFLPEERVARKGFTGAAWNGDSILVCSFNAVWRFDRAWRCTGRIHQPDFNDLHGVCVDARSDRIVVANTGLDAIEVFSLDARFRGRVALSPGWLEADRQRLGNIGRQDFDKTLKAGWESVARPPRASADGEYYGGGDEVFHRRKVRDYLHPTHVAVAPDGRILVTLLATREVRCLQSFSTLASIEGHPHDGMFVGAELWLTTTDGRIWAINEAGEVRVVMDTSRSGHLGWCRGLAVGPDWVAVGLTAVSVPPLFPWRADAFERTESSVLWLRRSDGALIGRMDLTDRERGTKVFALLPWGSR